MRLGRLTVFGTSQKTCRYGLNYLPSPAGSRARNFVRKKKLKLLAIVVFSAMRVGAFESADTTYLNEVSVIADVVRNDVVPVQSLTGDELQRLNSLTVADAMRYFSGLQIKDYGGVGGLKTVNVRSMGTHHTSVVYDGVELGNAQNGQIDLGQFSLDNIEEISLHNGQKSNILQPAKDFGSAASVYMQTKRPHFLGNKKFNFRGALKTGSFDLLNVAALAEMKFSPRVSGSLSVEGLTSSGKYKFRLRRFAPDGSTVYDTTAVRQNGDINAVRVEANVYGRLAVGAWTAKVYNYSSKRGLPGAVVNNVWHRGERQSDCNTFVQGSWQAEYGRFASLCNLKYAYYATHYVNNDPRVVRIDNRYRQHEVYASMAHRYKILPAWEVSLSYDFQYNSLWSDMRDFVMPRRISNFVALATSVDLTRLKFMASATGIFIHDKDTRRGVSKHRKSLTPAFYASVYPLRANRELSVRAFVKQSYRMPTFNDLFYTDVGNAQLQPERVTQYNVGAIYERTSSRMNSWLAAVRLSADFYLNMVTDKIVAYPKGQLFRWTMLNLGKVDIRGADISALVSVNATSDLVLTLRGQYTYQRAIDVTEPSASYYRHQIPYIPRHSGSVVFNMAYQRWALNMSYIRVGSRYNKQENIKYNYMAPWQTMDVSLGRDFTFGKVGLRALLEVNNVLNQDYAVIVNYPMPGRNYRLTLTVDL